MLCRKIRTVQRCWLRGDGVVDQRSRVNGRRRALRKRRARSFALRCGFRAKKRGWLGDANNTQDGGAVVRRGWRVRVGGRSNE